MVIIQDNYFIVWLLYFWKKGFKIVLMQSLSTSYDLLYFILTSHND